VVVVAPPWQADPAAALRLAAYRGAIVHPTAGLCARHAFAVCGPDLYALLEPGVDFVLDGVHPNGRGHAKIAEALAAFLRTLEASGESELSHQAVEGRAIDAEAPRRFHADTVRLFENGADPIGRSPVEELL
jgi:hypothetical protein